MCTGALERSLFVADMFLPPSASSSSPRAGGGPGAPLRGAQVAARGQGDRRRAVSNAHSVVVQLGAHPGGGGSAEPGARAPGRRGGMERGCRAAPRDAVRSAATRRCCRAGLDPRVGDGVAFSSFAKLD